MRQTHRPQPLRPTESALSASHDNLSASAGRQGRCAAVLTRAGQVAMAVLGGLLWTAMPARGQERMGLLYGDVRDAFTYTTLPTDSLDVEVTLMRKDSTVVQRFVCEKGKDRYAQFSMRVPEQREGSFLLRYTCPGYQTHYESIKLLWRNRETKYDCSTTLRRLSESSSGDRQLGEATVKATKIKFYMKDDTLVYNANAFQLQEGSMLDALIAQLPGAELKPDGRILVKGRQVESLLLNGRDFFKGDNTVLLDNLPAYMVQQVQVYEKESDLSKLEGRKVDNGTYVMDVKLKKQYSIGWMANTEWGGGTDKRYLGRLFAMRYTPQSRISVFGNLNNVNDRRKPDGNGGWGDFDASGGLTATKRAGMDYNVYDKRERFSVEGNVDVNYTDNDDAWGGNSTYFLPDGNTHDVSRYHSSKTNFNVSTSHQYKQTGKKNKYSFSLSPSFNYHNNDNAAFFQNGTFSTLPEDYYDEVLDSLYPATHWWPGEGWTSNLSDLIRRNGQQSMGNNRGSDGRLSFWSYFKAPLTYDGMSVEANVNYSDNDKTYFNHYLLNTAENGAWQNDTRNRFQSSPSNSFGYRLFVIYFWHWTDNIMFNPSYTFNYNNRSGDELNYRLDRLADSKDQPLGWLPSSAKDWLDALDDANSYKTEERSYNHNVTLDWQLQHYENTAEGRRRQTLYVQFRPRLVIEKTNYLYGLPGHPERDQRVKKTYYLPQVDLNAWHKTRGDLHRLALNAQLSSSSPAMFNLVDKDFNNDPLNRNLGNPGLKPTYNVHATFNYQADKWLQAAERQLYGNLGYHYTHNAVATSYVYNRENGARTNQPVNVDGNWSTWGNIGFTTPLDKKRKFTLTTNTSGSFYHTVDYMSDDTAVDPQRTTTRSTGINESLRLNYRYGILNLGLKGQANYNHATSDRSDYTNVDLWQFNGGFSAIIDMPWQMQFSTELNYRALRGYDYDEMNRNDFVWNARLTQRLCKNRLTLTLDAWDILGNLNNINSGINSQMRWAQYTNVIPRYVMFRIAYRLEVQPKKK